MLVVVVTVSDEIIKYKILQKLQKLLCLNKYFLLEKQK